MEFDQDPVAAPPPARRKPRARASKAAPPEKTPAPALASHGLDDFKPAEEILDLPVEEMPARKSGALAQLDFAMPVLAAALVLFLFSQVLALRQNASALTWRARSLDLQTENIKSVRDNTISLLKQRELLVNEGQRLSTSYNELFTDLLKLAKTDGDARAVVEKFNIKIATPPATPPAKE